MVFAIFPPFVGHFEYCSMMPRWHLSDYSSERYQEVKSIKIFYAAHISRHMPNPCLATGLFFKYNSLIFFFFFSEILLYLFIENMLTRRHTIFLRVNVFNKTLNEVYGGLVIDC